MRDQFRTFTFRPRSADPKRLQTAGKSEGSAAFKRYSNGWFGRVTDDTQMLFAHQIEIRLAFRPDGGLLLTASDDKTARLWREVPSGRWVSVRTSTSVVSHGGDDQRPGQRVGPTGTLHVGDRFSRTGILAMLAAMRRASSPVNQSAIISRSRRH